MWSPLGTFHVVAIKFVNPNCIFKHLGSCEPVSCEPLAFLENGQINPPECATRPQPGGQKCSFSCNQGYTLQGRKSTTCSKKTATWKNDLPRCETDFPKPFIMCPSDITKPLTGRTGSVYVMIPQPKTNVDWAR